MAEERIRTRSMDAPAAGSGATTAEIRRLIMLPGRFDEVLELCREGAARARARGDLRTWRRVACQGSTALYWLGRFDEGVRWCDEVVDSARADEDPNALGHAWNISTICAYRLARPDTLRRLDGALVVGERLLAEEGRLDSLCRAAASAGTIGLAELGDAILSRSMEHLDAGVAGDISTGGLAYLRSRQVLMRLWQALALEHEGDPRALGLFQRNVETIAALSDLLDPARLPAKTIAAFRAYEAIALMAVGHRDRARTALAAASQVLPAESFDMIAGAVELLCGLTRLRAVPPLPGGRSRAHTRHLIEVAQRCRDMRIEAELWRIAAALAEADGDPQAAALATERFEALTDTLDWRERLNGAQVLDFQSTALHRAALRHRSPA